MRLCFAAPQKGRVSGSGWSVKTQNRVELGRSAVALEGTQMDGMDLSALIAGLSAGEISALTWGCAMTRPDLSPLEVRCVDT